MNYFAAAPTTCRCAWCTDPELRGCALQDRIDDLWGLVWRRIGTAHPRTKETHTVDVGHVHVLAEPGGSCAPGCPHPDHRTEETPDE